MVKGRGSVNGPYGEQRRRPPRVGVVLLVLSTLFFGVNFAQEWWVGHQVRQEAAQLQQQIDATNAYNKQLGSAKAYYASKSYVTRHAREIGMSRPKDVLLVYQQGPPHVRVVHVTKPAPAPENIFARLVHAVFQ